MKFERDRVLAILCTASLGTIPGHALAQSTADTADFSAEDIVVTAQRRSETVQNIPIAIQAIGSERLEQAGVVQIGQLAATTPGFVYSQTGPQPTVSLRGLGAELYQIGGEPSVSLSLDGVPLLRQNYFLGAMFDLERVEILRGPQGTIAGRSSTGGAINLLTRKPNFDEWTGGADASYGNFDAADLGFWVSGPISENIAAHVAVERRSKDGFVKSSITGQRYGGQDDVLARASISARPVDGVELTLGADFFDSDDNSSAFVGRGIGTPGVTVVIGPNGFGSTPDYDPRTRRGTIAGLGNGQSETFTQRQYGLNFRGEFELGPETTVRTVTGYRRLRGAQNYDAVRANVPINAVDDRYRQTQFSQEIALTTSFGPNVDALLGGQYLHENATEVTSLAYLEGLASPSFAGANAFSASLYDTIKLRSYAVFGQLAWEFVPTWTVTLGGRYTHDKKIYSGGIGLPFGAPLQLAVAPTSSTFKSVTPRIAVDWKPSRDLTAYASVSKGFKAGGYATGNGISLLTGTPVEAFRPETVWNYEIGVKSSLFDRRLTANLTAFWADFKNLQYPFAQVGGVRIANAGRARSRGVELELDYRPDARFQLGFSATYLDATYREFITADPSRPPTSIFGVPIPGVEQLPTDQAGNSLTKAPKFSYVANSSYKIPLSDTAGSITIYADYKYQSRIHFAPFENSYESQKAYGLINGRIGWESANERWQIAVFGRNLANKRYFTGKTVSQNNLAGIDPRLPADPNNPLAQVVPTSVAVGVVGAPRMYGISLGYQF